MEWLHSCWRRILPLIGRHLASQTKVELPHAVVLEVVGPHRCKDLTNRAEVFFDRSIIDRLPLHGQKAGTDVLGENLEEGNGALNVFEVRGNLHPAAEALPLAPGGGVFLEDGCREPLGDCLLCRTVVICCLHPDGRGIRRQGLLCGKCVYK